MNQSVTATKLSAKTLKEIFHAAKFCQTVFVEKDFSNLEVALEQLTKLVAQGVRQSPILTVSCLNLTHVKFGYFTNLLVKTAITSHLFSTANKFSDEAAEQITKTNLLILFAITHPLMQIKAAPTLFKKYRKYIVNGAAVAFKTFKDQPISDQNCLRLLSQLANANKYSNSNMRAQSVCSLALNTTLLSFPFLNQPKLTLNQALKKVMAGTKIIQTLAKLDEWAVITMQACCSIGFSGSLVKLAAGKYAITLGLQDKDDWLVFEFSENKLNTNASLSRAKNENILSVIPQQSMDLFVLVSLFNDHLEQLRPHLAKQFAFLNQVNSIDPFSSEGMIDTAKILQSDNRKDISNFLNADFDTKQLILDYACRINRQQLNVKDINHALALIGTYRLFPVVADSKLRSQLARDQYLGAAEVVNKVDRYASTVLKVAQAVKFNGPEYAMLIARLLFVALTRIPRARYSVSGHAQRLTPEPTDLANMFAPSTLGNWYKISLKICQAWQLPKFYLAAVKAYFDMISNKVTLAALPKSNREFVALIQLSSLLYGQLLRGNATFAANSVSQDCIKVLGFEVRELRHLYNEIVDEIAPHSSLM